MYHQERTRHHFFVCRREYFTPAMRGFLKDPDAFLQNQPITYLKYQEGEPTTVAIVTLDGRPFVLKRYNLIMRLKSRPGDGIRILIMSK